MNCDEVRNLLFSYIDNETDEDEKLLIEEHINNCDECKKELEEYKKIIKALNDLPDEEPPAGYCKRLHEKLLNSKVTVFKDESVIENNTPKRRKSKYSWLKYGSLAAALVLIFTIAAMNNLKLTGMKSSENSAYDQAAPSAPKAAPSPTMPESPAEMTADGVRGYGDTEYDYNRQEMAALEESGYDAKDKISTMSVPTKEMKIIKSGTIYTQTEDYDSFLNDLEDKINSLGGFIENNNTEVYRVYDDNKLMYGNLKLRVPQESFYELINYLEDFTEVRRKNVSENDVTKEYYEKDNKVKNLEVQEQHLRDLFEKAQTVEEMLQIENELRRIRTEIDALNISLADINDRAEMSTINLEVEEVRAVNFTLRSEKGVWERAKEGFISTVNSIVKGFGNFIVSIVSAAPIVVPAAIVFIILLVKIRKYWKKRI
ncbi:DUF4349 domain-containing protein [Sedimentibacter sp.]|uniref:DUF4349 domain-containing protein n=1 Tax=Sedimentibacter sp. TaxID=1960295 RepID=UPI0028B258E2|nr:DUF4349 domain-containing protein [Sedimentibacter sp.]